MIISCGPDWSTLEQADESDLKVLRRAFTFREAGAFFKSRWVQTDYGFIEGNRFPSGLLLPIAKFCNKQGIRFTIERKPLHVSTLVERKTLPGVTLQPFQKESEDKFFRVRRGILKLPTGAGKTVIAASIINQVVGNCLFIVDRQELAKQSVRELQEILGEPIGLIGKGAVKLRRVTVALVKSLAARLDNDKVQAYLRSVSLLVQDETHRAGAITAYTTNQACPAPMRLALSATPETKCPVKDARIQGSFGEIIHEVPFKHLVEIGWLARPHVFQFTLDEPVEYGPYGKMYQKRIVESKIRTKKVVEQTKTLFTYGVKTLVLVGREEHGTALTAALKEAGVPCDFVWYKTKNRDQLVSDFKTNKLRVLVASSILREGIDIKDIEAVVLAAGEKSHIATVQSLGRGTRKKPINRVYVLDFIDLNQEYMLEHSIIREREFRNLGCTMYPLDTPLPRLAE